MSNFWYFPSVGSISPSIMNLISEEEMRFARSQKDHYIIGIENYEYDQTSTKIKHAVSKRSEIIGLTLEG